MRHEMAHEPSYLKHSLARKDAIVKAPVTVARMELGRIGKLDMKDLCRRDSSNCGQLIALWEHVKTVQAEAQVGVINSFDEAPGMIVAGDATPGYGFVGKPYAAVGGSLG
jgi:hypothetical protein